MNTRILRMCQRRNVLKARVVDGLGQVQPVIFSVDNGHTVLRIEGEHKGHACWWRLPLPQCKAQAKALFAELETCHRNGTKTAAAVYLDIARR